jgi:pilus assembly protein CpaE
VLTKPHSSQAKFSVFTVCADEETVTNAMDGCAYAPETEFSGAFHEYIGRNKRPKFSQRVKDSAACIAIIDFDRNVEQAVQTTLLLHQIFPGKVATVAISARSDSELLLQAMRAGCTEFLPQPFDLERFTETIARLQNRFVTLSSHTAKSTGSVISMFGVKGGVGTTTLSTHLATFLVLQHRKKVLLIDHHHQLGHASLYLGVKVNPYHFDELIRNVDRLDAELLAGFLTHHPSGLDLLPSPDMCAVRYNSTPPEMQQVLEFLRPQYDFVILDSSLEYQDVNSSIIDCSDEVYLVATPDVAALRDLSRHVENFALDETAASKLRIVLNRSASGDAVTPEQVESAVRFPVSVSVANNYAELVQAINSGQPISPQRRSEFTTQISKWANRLVQVHCGLEPEAPRRKGFSFWK